jgi:predicted Zn-dependent protease
MIGKDKALSRMKDVLKGRNEEQIELLVVARDVGCTRYANSVIHQNVHEDAVSVFIRVLEGGRVGLVMLSSLDGEELSRCISKAKEAAARGSIEERFKAFPTPCDYTEVSAFSDETANFDHGHRVERLGKIFTDAGERGIQMAGAFTTGKEEIAIVNTNGIEAYHASTFYDVSFTALSSEASGHSGKVGTDIKELDITSLANTAIDKALAGKGSVALSPGKYTVILEPKALAELLEWTSYIAFGAERYQEETSFMKGKIGERIAGENITLYDDGLEPLGFPRSFDYEGVPKGRVDIIRHGIAESVVYDTLHGSREGRASTGNATLPHSEDGPIPLNLFVEKGDISKSEIITSTERAVLVTRFHYVNGLLEPEVALMTGMTRDGTFLVEDGEVTKKVEDMRFTDSVLRILNNVTAISIERESIKSWWSDEGVYTVPYIRVEEMTFTGRTG